MRFQILTIGKPKLAYAKAGVEEYLKRLRAWGGVEIVSLKAADCAQESASLLARSDGMFRVALDERGEKIASRELAARVGELEIKRVKAVAFLIGGADGHTDELREEADWVWALSTLTLQHELALVVLLEQLYRIRAIHAGAPYHRD